MILQNQREKFDIPAGITFLNCAYMSPSLKAVSEAGNKAIDARKQPWNYKIADWFEPGEKLKSLFAEIIHADKENIALIPSASYGIAVAANNMSPERNKTILLLEQEYPSNVYAWYELSRKSGCRIIMVKRKPKQSWSDAVIENINPDTGVVSVPNCHWTDGSFVDLEKISIEARRVNAKLVIDASQSAGAFPLNIKKIKPDFLITVGYKWLLGPYGLGYLYADSKYFDNGKPVEFPWIVKKGSEDFAKLVDYRDEYEYGARRFDAGGFSSFIHIPMATAALTQIFEWGVENIQATLSALTAGIDLKVKELNLESPERNDRVGHIVGIRVAESAMSGLSKTLAANNIFASFRGTNLRIAPHLFNEKRDIQKLLDLLQANLA